MTFYTSASTRIQNVSLVGQIKDSEFTIHLHIKTLSSEVNSKSHLDFDGGIGIVEMLF
jgi:hypothetical protein